MKCCADKMTRMISATVVRSPLNVSTCETISFDLLLISMLSNETAALRIFSWLSADVTGAFMEMHQKAKCLRTVKYDGRVHRN